MPVCWDEVKVKSTTRIQWLARNLLGWRLGLSEKRMNERNQSHEAYGDELTPKLRGLFPSEELDICHQAEVDNLHFSIAWGRGQDGRNMQLLIVGNAIDDYLTRESIAEEAEKRLLDFVKGKIREMAAISTPQEVVVLSEHVRVY
jgi:hypothetical protein